MFLYSDGATMAILNLFDLQSEHFWKAFQHTPLPVVVHPLFVHHQLLPAKAWKRTMTTGNLLQGRVGCCCESSSNSTHLSDSASHNLTHLSLRMRRQTEDRRTNEARSDIAWTRKVRREVPRRCAHQDWNDHDLGFSTGAMYFLQLRRWVSPLARKRVY